MANRGSLNTSTMPETSLKIYFDWEIINIDPVAGTGEIKYKLYGKSNKTTKYRVFGTRSANNRNYCDIDNTAIFQVNNIGSGSKSDPYKMYTREDQHSMSPYYASTSSGYNFNGWVVKIGKLAEGTVPISYDDNGNASFTVYGVFQCLYGAGSDKRVYLNKDRTPIQVDQIERFSRSPVTTTNGATWTKDKYVWKTTDYGATWSKCNMYKTTDSGTNWSKVN